MPIKLSPEDNAAIKQLVQDCRSAIVHWAVAFNRPIFGAVQDHETGPAELMLSKWRERVEQAATQGPDHLLAVQFKRCPKMNLIPILLDLSDSGISVLVATADERDFLLILQKTVFEYMGTGKHHAFLMTNSGLFGDLMMRIPE